MDAVTETKQSAMSRSGSQKTFAEREPLSETESLQDEQKSEEGETKNKGEGIVLEQLSQALSIIDTQKNWLESKRKPSREDSERPDKTDRGKTDLSEGQYGDSLFLGLDFARAAPKVADNVVLVYPVHNVPPSVMDDAIPPYFRLRSFRWEPHAEPMGMVGTG